MVFKRILSAFIIVFYLVTPLQALQYCPNHYCELKKIKYTAVETIVEAHRLTGDIIGSYFVTIYDIADTTVKNHATYSDYMTTLSRLAGNCSSNGNFLASNRIHQGINTIGNMYLDLYDNCIQNHRSSHSIYQRGKIHFDRGNTSQCLEDIRSLLDSKDAEELLQDFGRSNVLLTQSEAYIEQGEYEKAIQTLSSLIEKDPANKTAYFQRATAYFETGNFDLALNDYLMSDKGKTIPKPKFKAPVDFSKALIKSACVGATEAAIDFVPSLCSSVYGVGTTLWTTVQHPIDATNDFANACYEMGECVADYCKDLDWNTVEGYADQVKVLCEQFNQLNDSQKGELIGHTIGKYGVDIFAGGAIFKGVSAYRNLKNANRLCNLEAMAISQANKEAIIASAIKHSTERNAYFKNVKLHVDRQNKHVPGAHNYESDKYRSILTHKDPQKLLRERAGTGIPKNNNLRGESGYVERVNFEEVIGYHIDGKNPTIQLPTTKGTIKYSKDGAHIVPSHPEG